VLHEPAGEIELVEPASLTDSGSALLLDRQSVTQVDERARNAAMGRLPAPSVRSAFSGSTRESPLVPWLIGTLTFAAGALAFACLLATIDRLLGLADAHRRLVNIGISRPKLARLTALNFALLTSLSYWSAWPPDFQPARCCCCQRPRCQWRLSA
jgi:hypothetical protein